MPPPGPRAAVIGPAPARLPRRPELDHDLRSRRLASHLAPPAREVDRPLGQAGAGDAAKAAARAQYGAGGRTSYDLSDRGQVFDLIRASPQIDDLKDTKADNDRCGGAAILNGLLLDGAHAKNADAILGTARSAGRPLRPLETQALARMREGHLTPNDAGRLQELIYDSARRLDGDPSGPPGLRGRDIGRAVSVVRAHGGFPNTEHLRVAFQDPEPGQPIGHANILHRDRGGLQAFADTWPEADGRATARPDFAGPGEFLDGGHPNGALSGDFTMEPRAMGNYFRLRFAKAARDPDTFTSYYQREVTLPPGVPLDATVARDREVEVPYRR